MFGWFGSHKGSVLILLLLSAVLTTVSAAVPALPHADLSVRETLENNDDAARGAPWKRTQGDVTPDKKAAGSKNRFPKDRGLDAEAKTPQGRYWRRDGQQDRADERLDERDGRLEKDDGGEYLSKRHHGEHQVGSVRYESKRREKRVGSKAPIALQAPVDKA